MKKDNFAEYAKELEGMERIELVIDLLVSKKITKDQAVVLIANDKQIKDKEVEEIVYPNWWSTPGTGTIPIPGYNPVTTTTNPYVISGSSTTTATYDSTLT